MKDFFRNNGLLILIIAILLTAITAVASFALGGVANPLANAIGVVVTPIRNGTNSFVHWVEGIYNYSFQYDALLAENDRLKAEIAELQASARQGEADSKENVFLRKAMGLREQRRDLVFESATITARSVTNWNSTLTLSKGTKEDVAVGDCVVDAAGNLVGIIDEVGYNWSTMITVVDANLEMGAKLARTDSTAVLEGDFALMTQRKLKLTYLPDNTELLTGDLVLTSSKEGTYPSGLVAGYIESIHDDASGMTRYAVVTPAATLEGLVQVLIIKDFDIVE